jgi:hypothetical protein
MIKGMVEMKLWFIWLNDLCTSEFNDKKKKNSHVSTKKMMGNITKSATEL